MVSTSRYVAYAPGDEVEVEALSDGTDEPTAGDLVEISGENDQFTEVKQNSGSHGKALGMLVSDPEDFDSSTSYSNNDSLGTATVFVFHPILYLDPASGYSSPAAGDLVQEADAGDVEAYTGATSSGVTTLTNTLGVDGSGTLENDTAGDLEVDLADAVPFGQVFSTRVRSLHIGDRIAVAKYR